MSRYLDTSMILSSVDRKNLGNQSFAIISKVVGLIEENLLSPGASSSCRAIITFNNTNREPVQSKIIGLSIGSGQRKFYTGEDIAKLESEIKFPGEVEVLYEIEGTEGEKHVDHLDVKSIRLVGRARSLPGPNSSQEITLPPGIKKDRRKPKSSITPEFRVPELAET